MENNEKRVLHYNRIIRGLENRNKNFKYDERIMIDDEGLVYQDGVDDDGIPILYMSYDDKSKEIVNNVREKIDKPKYDWVGGRTVIGLTKKELIRKVEKNPCEIIPDMPDEIEEYREALRKFQSEWHNKLCKEHIPILIDTSDIWDGVEFVENKFAKKEKARMDEERKISHI